MTVVEDYSPIRVGDTGAKISPVFVHKDGTPQPLDGVIITMKLIGLNTGIVKTCSNAGAGAWILDDIPNGKAHRQWQASDVDTADTWRISITLMIDGGPLHADERVIEILNAP